MSSDAVTGVAFALSFLLGLTLGWHLGRQEEVWRTARVMGWLMRHGKLSPLDIHDAVSKTAELEA